MKKLVRIKKNGIVGGVLSGFGEYFSIDPVILRVAYIVLFFFDWFRWLLIAGYIVCWIILPSGEAADQIGSAREIKDQESIGLDQNTSKSQTTRSVSESTPENPKETSSGSSFTFIAACVLIGLGLFLLLENVIPAEYFNSLKKFSVAFVLIVIGFLLFIPSMNKKKGE